MAMFQTLLRGTLALISTGRCPLCSGAVPADASSQRLCESCRERLALSTGGLQGDQPLLWCALAPYGGPLRGLLLAQRPRPVPSVMEGLAAELLDCCSSAIAGGLLVPIPSWKRAANPLPQLIAKALATVSGGRVAVSGELLQRSRPTVGQHHLNRTLRLRNQLGSFQCVRQSRPVLAGLRRRGLWLVDDILTTGATAQAAALVLEAEGLRVEGLLCLARTPAPS
jgi:predicted amidophosphoribosyltransferase